MSTSYLPKSKSDTHLTPDRVYEIIKNQWGIEKEEMFDPCPEDPKGYNGLTDPWRKLNYVNPPYSLLSEFVHRAIAELDEGNTTIMLLPSKTDQQWFHDLPDKNNIFWIRGRLKFKNNIWNPPQPHFLIFLDPRYRDNI